MSNASNYRPTRKERREIGSYLADSLGCRTVHDIANTDDLDLADIEEAIADYYTDLWYDADYPEMREMAERLAPSFDGIDVALQDDDAPELTVR